MNFFRRFKRFAHIPINEMNELYGAVHAAHSRLSKIEVSDTRTMHEVEKQQVLSLLEDAKQITSRWT